MKICLITIKFEIPTQEELNQMYEYTVESC